LIHDVSTQESDIGLAADVGSLAYLPKLTGNQSLLRELAYTARNFSASEAEKLGLVSRVVPGGRDQVVQAALELAKTIAAKSPIAVSGTKRLVSHARDHSVEENLVYTQSWNAHALMKNAGFLFFDMFGGELKNFSLTQDVQENISTMQKRWTPKFDPLRIPSKL